MVPLVPPITRFRVLGESVIVQEGAQEAAATHLEAGAQPPGLTVLVCCISPIPQVPPAHAPFLQAPVVHGTGVGVAEQAAEAIHLVVAAQPGIATVLVCCI